MMLSLNEMFAAWREIYENMLAMGASPEEALEALANMMLGDL